MRRRRALPALMLAAVVVPAGVAAADPNRADLAVLRKLHFDYGLVAACGRADDEIEAGYRLRVTALEQRLGIDDDPEARFREINLGWTEKDADWAAKGGPAFRDRCGNEAAAAGARFRDAFRDTGETLNPLAKGKRK